MSLPLKCYVHKAHHTIGAVVPYDTTNHGKKYLDVSSMYREEKIPRITGATLWNWGAYPHDTYSMRHSELLPNNATSHLTHCPKNKGW